VRGVLIGRASELERIGALDEGEGPAALVLVGDPGSGKSRLLAEGEARSTRDVFRVVGYEPERLVPLAAASELLRAVAADAAFGPTAGKAVEPVRVFEAAHRALQEAGAALLVVDDVQWIDDLSLALLHYVVRAAESAGGDVAVLAAGRPASRTHAFADDMSGLLPHGRAGVIELGGLSLEDALRLALALDPALGDAGAVAVWERSGGLPFWIEVLARTDGEPIEAGRLLTARLRDATADAAELLGALAIVARPTPVEDVAALLRRPAPRVVAAADELVARGVAVQTAAGLALSHDLIREAAAAELPARRRVELHRAVAARLEEAADDDLSMLRAALEHRAAAGEPTLDLAVRVISAPQRRRLGAEGLAALAAVADEADATEPGVPQLLRGVAQLASELGERQVALARWPAVALLAEEPEARFEALLEASKAAFELGWEHAGRAHELLAEATANATSAEALVRARAHEARIVLWLDHRTQEGARLALDALARSRALSAGPDRHRARLEALQAAQQAAMQEADGEAMLRLAEEMIVETRGGDETAYVAALLARAVGQSWTLPLAVAEASARDALDLAMRRFLPVQAAGAAAFLALVMLDRGCLDEAERIAEQERQLAVLVGGRQPTRLVGYELRLAREGPGPVLPEYVREVDALPDPHVRVIPRHVAAQFLSRTAGPGGRDEVVALLERAKEDAAAAGCPRCQFELCLVSAGALARVGCGAEGEAALRRAESMGMEHAFLRLRRHSVALLAAMSDPAAAANELRHLCEEYARLDRRVDLLWARVDLARVLGEGDRDEAVETLRDVAVAADAIGAHSHVRVAEQELRRLGVRTWRRGRSRVEDGSLSEREREVAELVASGASNPEIAQALFLSRKTVERHVSNALAKYGVRNRAELAALLSREGEGAPR